MIRIRNLRKQYGDVQVLSGLCLEVSQGELMAVMGRSGGGKTTLLRLIAGLERPDEGTVHIGGLKVSDPSGLKEPHKRKLSMIFQDLALWPHMTALQHVVFAAGSRPRRAAHPERLLDRVGLKNLHGRYPHQLSGGEKQRLAIARALAPGPGVLLLDEPFNNLDPFLKVGMLELISELRDKEGMTMVYVSHLAEEVVGVADRVAFLNRGEITHICDGEEGARRLRERFSTEAGCDGLSMEFAG